MSAAIYGNLRHEAVTYGKLDNLPELVLLPQLAKNAAKKPHKAPDLTTKHRSRAL